MRHKKAFSACLVMAAVMTGNTVVAPSAMAYNAADVVVDYAKSRTDIQGKPNEVTYYFDSPDAEWCQMFIYYCAMKCGMEDLIPYTTYCDYTTFPNGGSDPGAVSFFKNSGTWYTVSPDHLPQRGDLIFFDQKDDGWIHADHVGFVDYVKEVSGGKFIHTVEGNSQNAVKLNSYNVTDGRIIGVGRPDYSKYDYLFTDPTPSTPPTVTKPAGTTTPPATTTTTTTPVDNTPTVQISVEYEVISDCGAWLRARHDFGNNRIGILSTSQRIYADAKWGDWVHIPSTVVESSEAHYEGWVHTSNLRVYTGVPYVPPVTEPVSPPAPSSPTVPTTPAAPTTPSAQPVDYGWSAYYQITSPDGAWARSYPSFGSDGKLGILNTGDFIEVMSVTDDYGWAYAKVCLDGWNYTNAYVHTSSLAPADSYGSVGSGSSGDTWGGSYGGDYGSSDGSYSGGSSTGSNGGSYDGDYSGWSQTYVVTCPEGARLRASAEYDDYNTIMVLDMNTQVEYLYYDGEWLCVKVSFDGGNSYSYGFVNCTMVSPLY